MTAHTTPQTGEAPHVPAAFINAIAAEGTKAEAIQWLQRTWNALCRVQSELRALKADMERAQHNHAADLTFAPSETKRIPAGWKLVPERPTEAMCEALGNTPWIVESSTKTVDNEVITTRKEFRDQRYVVDGWIAMINAAPEAPK